MSGTLETILNIVKHNIWNYTNKMNKFNEVYDWNGEENGIHD